MSSSPCGTVPATSSVSQFGVGNLLNQTTCLAGPPTLRRAMTRTIFISWKREQPAQMIDIVFSSGANTGPLLRQFVSKTRAHFGRTFQLHLIGPRFGDQIGGAQQAFKCACVSPPTFKFLPRHRFSFDVSVVDVGYFKLATAGRL